MQIYRFGGFELDLDSFELKLPGKPVKLERRALDLLALLVRQPNRLVPREEIIAALWPPNVVIDFDSGLNTLVRKVRTALGDSSDSPRFIETIPGRGYRFVASVESVTSRTTPADGPPAEAAPANRRRWPVGVAALAAIVIAAALVSWWSTDRHSGPTRIAVQPFENLTGDSNLAWLASGLAEETSSALAQIDRNALRVVRIPAPSTSGTPPSAHELGQKLGVDFVVQSTMKLDGERIRVTSRMVRVADAEEVWSAGLNRALTNVIGVQQELSTAIAEQIRQRLSPEVAAAIARRQTQNPAAYALYLKARYEWNKLTPSATRRAIEYFDEATKLDPDYALAWAGLSWGSITSVRSADASPIEAAPIAKHALDEALRLGPDLVETQAALGYYRLFHDLDQQGAEQAARKAIELDPNSAFAYQLLGMSLMRQGSRVEALEMMQRARQLEPMFTLAFANSANLALSYGDVARAMEFARQAIAIDPDFWLGHHYLAGALRAQGQTDAALKEYEEAARLSDGHSITYKPRATILQQQGRQTELQALVDEARQRAATRYFSPYVLATLELKMGNKDAAFALLDYAVETRDPSLFGLKRNSDVAQLRDDPRFAKLVERCKCSPESVTAR